MLHVACMIAGLKVSVYKLGAGQPSYRRRSIDCKPLPSRGAHLSTDCPGASPWGWQIKVRSITVDNVPKVAKEKGTRHVCVYVVYLHAELLGRTIVH
jgi:hypothetical protein